MTTLITILGILVLIAPYILVLKSFHKLKTFLTILAYTASASIVIALVTQSLQIFNYVVILFLHTLIALYCVYLFKKREVVGSISHKTLSTRLKRFNSILFPVVFFLLAAYLLYSVHFNYSGFVDSVFGLQKVSHSSYSYPMYSDEWIGVSFIDYSVRTGTLPLANPLDGGTLFPNFLFVSHSLFAEIAVLLGVDVIESYIYFAILNTLLICLAVYFILRHFNIRATIAAITAFSILLLTNSGNLPGLWSLLPYTASLMFLLYSILAHLVKEEKVASINMIISLVVYPPMLVFIVPILLAYKGASVKNLRNYVSIKPFIIILKNFINSKVWLKRFLVLLTICLVFTLFFVSKGFSFYEVCAKIISYIVRTPLDQGRVYYAIWNIVPVYMIPFALYGIYLALINKMKVFVYPLATGVFFWVLYCFQDTVFLIEPARVVIISSVFLIIVAGFGLEKFYTYIKHKSHGTFFDLADPALDFGIKVLVFVFFVFWTINIGRFGLWHKLPLEFQKTIITTNGSIQHLPQKLYPAPPVTRYLTKDDLRLFAGYSGKRFIAPKWKGLVLGVATHNYPLDSKPSMITNNILSYEEFSGANCEQKKKYIDTYKIDLVYTASTTCPYLNELGRSSESLYLYSINPIHKNAHTNARK